MEDKVKDSPQDGIVKSYFDDGSLLQKTTYKKGKREGLQEFYHENGQKFSKGYFKNDESEGLWEYFREDGKLGFTGHYKDGKQSINTKNNGGISLLAHGSKNLDNLNFLFPNQTKSINL